MNKNKVILLSVIMSSLLVFSGCASDNESETKNETKVEIEKEVKEVEEVKDIEAVEAVEEVKILPYNHEKTGMNFEYPNSWLLADTGVDYKDTKSVFYLDTDKTGNNFGYGYLPLTEEEYINFDEFYIGSLRDGSDELKIISEEEVKINNLNFYKFEFAQVTEDSNYQFIQYVTKIYQGAYSFTVTFSGNVDLDYKSEKLSDVEALLKTVVIDDIFSGKIVEEEKVNENMYAIENGVFTDYEFGTSFVFPENWELERLIDEENESYQAYAYDDVSNSGVLLTISDFGDFDVLIEETESVMTNPDAIDYFYPIGNGEVIEGKMYIYVDKDEAGVEKQFVEFIGKNEETNNAIIYISLFEKMGMDELKIFDISDKFEQSLIIN